ncbi:MAG: hypothetical protein CFE45_21885, partial [Burkholderiales bacterium PBB5]
GVPSRPASPAAPVAAEPIDLPALRAALLALRPLLLSHDTAAIDQIDHDRAVLQQGPQPLYATLSAQARAFAFGPALALLDEALAALDAR